MLTANNMFATESYICVMIQSKRNAFKRCQRLPEMCLPIILALTTAATRIYVFTPEMKHSDSNARMNADEYADCLTHTMKKADCLTHTMNADE